MPTPAAPRRRVPRQHRAVRRGLQGAFLFALSACAVLVLVGFVVAALGMAARRGLVDPALEPAVFVGLALAVLALAAAAVVGVGFRWARAGLDAATSASALASATDVSAAPAGEPVAGGPPALVRDARWMPGDNASLEPVRVIGTAVLALVFLVPAFGALLGGVLIGGLASQPILLAVILGFCAAASWVAHKLTHGLVRGLRFGTYSYFEQDHLPAQVGGFLEGLLHVPGTVHAAGHLDVWLECRRPFRMDLRVGRRFRSPEWLTVWRAGLRIPAEAGQPTSGGVAIPISLPLPTQGLAASLRNVSWVLNARARLPGLDYLDRFSPTIEIPSSLGEAAPKRRDVTGAAPIAPRQRLALQTTRDGAIVRAPAGGQWRWAVLPLAAAVVAAVLRPDWIAERVRSPAWIGALLLYEGLILLGAAVTGRVIEIRGQDVDIRGAFFGILFRETVRRDQVTSVHASTTLGSPPSFSVAFETGVGTPVDARLVLRTFETAAALADDLERALARP
jgi:hypothetical protein